jgi:hypothetical protein
MTTLFVRGRMSSDSQEPHAPRDGVHVGPSHRTPKATAQHAVAGPTPSRNVDRLRGSQSALVVPVPASGVGIRPVRDPANAIGTAQSTNTMQPANTSMSRFSLRRMRMRWMRSCASPYRHT